MNVFGCLSIEQIRLHRLESLISMKAPIERQETGNEVASPSQRMPNVTRGTIDSSQPFLPQLCRCSSPIDQYLTERIQPKQNIVIQGVRRRMANHTVVLSLRVLSPTFDDDRPRKLASISGVVIRPEINR